MSLITCLVPFSVEHSTCFVALRYGLGGCSTIPLRMSPYVLVIPEHGVEEYKMAYHADKILHIGAVTMVNNTLHSVMLRIHYIKGLILIQKACKVL